MLKSIIILELGIKVIKTLWALNKDGLQREKNQVKEWQKTHKEN